MQVHSWLRCVKSGALLANELAHWCWHHRPRHKKNSSNALRTFLLIGSGVLLLACGGGTGIGTNTSNNSASRLQPALAAGSDHSLLLKSDGGLWAWGNDAARQLGDGTGIQQSSPTAIGTKFVAVAASAMERITLGLKDDTSLWAWGSNTDGQLGDGTVLERLEPVLVGSGFRAVAAGFRRSFGIKSDDSLWGWGVNGAGQLGDGSTTKRLTPVLIGSDFLAVAAAEGFTVALKTDGGLWVWGFNYGLLGDGRNDYRTAPVQIGSGYVAIAAGRSHALALKADGSLWSWGQNGEGQLGDGTTVHRATPVLVGTDFIAVSAGESHTVALKDDGSLWAWGFNSYGQLGDGSTTNRLSPVPIDANYSAVAAGSNHTLALKPDGSVWTWGFNGSGQLGDGSLSNRMTPLQILGPGSSTMTANLTVTNNGSGMVQSEPSGIACGSMCTKSFDFASQVTLTATPNNGFALSRWSGACSGSTTCTISMNEAKKVDAHFKAVTTVSVVLSNLDVTYNATPQSAVCSTTPPGLATSIVYSDLGIGIGRKNVGNYGVTCIVMEDGYSGSAAGILVISQFRLVVTPPQWPGFH